LSRHHILSDSVKYFALKAEATLPDDYEPRVRPWFKKAKSTGQIETIGKALSENVSRFKV
jgi:hypothetical protein